MRKLFLIIFINFICWNLIAQQKVIFNFEKGSSFLKYKDKNPGLNYLKLINAAEKDKSILIFIGFSDTDSVKVSNKNEIILNKNLYNSPQTGISEIRTIDNTLTIKVEFLKEIPVEIILDKKKLKKYKHIYISRKNNIYLVEFYNRLKFFG